MRSGVRSGSQDKYRGPINDREPSLSASAPRVAAALVGDIKGNSEVRIKYGLLFDALGERLPLVEVYNADLQGTARVAAAVRSFRPDRARWRELFRKNVSSFRARSRHAVAHLARLRGEVDVVLQLGCLFDCGWGSRPLPSVIYTDYTARLSMRHPEAGRSPLGPRALERWLRLERDAYHRAHHVLTRSELVRANLIEEYSLAPESVSAIGGGVNFARLPASTERDRSPGAPTALFIGRDLYRKGGDLLLKAFAEARRKVPGARLFLVTRDPIPSSLPLDGVSIVTPTWDRERLSSLYRMADLFVLPSRLETWGDVLLEAMAHGVPCLGVRGQAMTEIITPGHTGYLVPPGDIAALAAAMTELLTDPECLVRWGENARQDVAERFTWSCVVDRMLPHLEAAGSER